MSAPHSSSTPSGSRDDDGRCASSGDQLSFCPQCEGGPGLAAQLAGPSAAATAMSSPASPITMYCHQEYTEITVAGSPG